MEQETKDQIIRTIREIESTADMFNGAYRFSQLTSFEKLSIAIQMEQNRILLKNLVSMNEKIEKIGDDFKKALSIP